MTDDYQNALAALEKLTAFASRQGPASERGAEALTKIVLHNATATRADIDAAMALVFSIIPAYLMTGADRDGIPWTPDEIEGLCDCLNALSQEMYRHAGERLRS